MCEPVSITMATIAVAGAAAGAFGAKSAADAAEDYQERLGIATDKRIKDNRGLAWADYKNKILQEQVGIAQARAQKAFGIQDMNLKGLQARSLAAVSAAEGGVQGNSLGVLLNDYSSQTSRFRTKSNLNQTFIDEKADSNIRSYGVEYVGRAMSIQPYIPSPVAQPNYLQYGLQAAGGVMGGMQSAGVFSTPQVGAQATGGQDFTAYDPIQTPFAYR